MSHLCHFFLYIENIYSVVSFSIEEWKVKQLTCKVFRSHMEGREGVWRDMLGCNFGLHLEEFIKETIRCPLWCLLHTQSLAKGRHDKDIRILDIQFNIHVAVGGKKGTMSRRLVEKKKIRFKTNSHTWRRTWRSLSWRLYSEVNTPWLCTWCFGL